MTTANLTVIDNETVVQYTSTGESVFTFPFPILSPAELKVSVDQVIKTIGADYTVSGVGAAGGGEVTFLAPTTAGERITLWLQMPIERVTGFSLGAAALMPEALNAELARATRVDQMLRRDIGRALQIAIDDPTPGQSMIVPTRDDRIGKFLAFDALGRPVASESTAGGDAALRADLAQAGGGALIGLQAGGTVRELGIATITDLLAVPGPINGQVAIVWERDRGGRFVYDAARSAENDGGTVFAGWVRQFEGRINVRWFGAKGDAIVNEVAFSAAAHSGGVAVAAYPYEIHELASGTDDTAAVVAAVAVLEEGDALYFPPSRGHYLIRNTTVATGTSLVNQLYSPIHLIGKKNIRFVGDGDTSRIFSYQDASDHSLSLFRLHGCENVVVEDLSINLQIVGWRDAGAFSNVQTRIALMQAFTLDGPTESPAVLSPPSVSCGLRRCRIRVNHPAGAYPGEPAGGLGGSIRMIGVAFYGDYAAPAAFGGQPPATVGIVDGCFVEDCLFVETQARVVWCWMTRRTRVLGNRFLRQCGGARPVIRVQHFNDDIEIDRNLVQGGNSWLDGVNGEVPITVSWNGGLYQSRRVKVSANNVRTHVSAGIFVNGIADSAVEDNNVSVDPAFTGAVGTSRTTAGIRVVTDPAYDGSADLRGEVTRVRFSGNRIQGKSVGMSLVGIRHCLIEENVAVDCVDAGIETSSRDAVQLRDNQAINCGVFGFLAAQGGVWTGQVTYQGNLAIGCDFGFRNTSPTVITYNGDMAKGCGESFRDQAGVFIQGAYSMAPTTGHTSNGIANVHAITGGAYLQTLAL